jgi:hypothetical protein
LWNLIIIDSQVIDIIPGMD